MDPIHPIVPSEPWSTILPAAPLGPLRSGERRPGPDQRRAREQERDEDELDDEDLDERPIHSPGADGSPSHDEPPDPPPEGPNTRPGDPEDPPDGTGRLIDITA